MLQLAVGVFKMVNCNLTRGLSIITILLVIETVLSLDAPAKISKYLAEMVCQQMNHYDKSNIIQVPVKSRPKLSEDENCGWHIFDNCGGADKSCRYKQFMKCGEGELGSPKIVGGEDAPRNGYPSILALRSYGDYICGATVINKYWIVTAAHCAAGAGKYPRSISITAGDHELNEVDRRTEQRIRCQKIVIHPNYTSEIHKLINDIALCKLEKPLRFNKFVQAVQLPSPNYREKGNLTAVGWGVKREGGRPSNVLQQVELTTINDSYCQQLYNGSKMTEKEICTLLPGKDGCQGDSGGPLYKIKKKIQTLIGITSWGKGCARPTFPGVWTEVAYFVQWIKKTILDEVRVTKRPKN